MGKALQRLKDLIDETVGLAKEFEEQMKKVQSLTEPEAEGEAQEWMLLAVDAAHEGLEADDVRIILTAATGVDFMEKRHGPDAEDLTSDRRYKAIGGD